MGKKKNSNKNKGDTESQKAAAPAAAAVESPPEEPAPAVEAVEKAVSDEPSSPLAAAAAPATAVEDMSIEQLRAEVLSQRQSLAAKDAEISQLKSQLQQGGKGVAASLPLADTKYPDVDSLRSRLEALRKEQEDADSARDKAWSQLKKVVGEISKLASPDFVTSLVNKSSDGKSSDLDSLVDKAK